MNRTTQWLAAAALAAATGLAFAQYEFATNLVSGAWNTGPAWATEGVTDNLNGTETVTVTVTPAVSTTTPLFFRLRISQPRNSTPLNWPSSSPTSR